MSQFEQSIDKIYGEIKSDLKFLIEGRYQNNADGFNQIANSESEAMDQIFSGSVKPTDCYHLRDLVKNKVNSYLEIGSYVGVGFRIFNEIFNPRISCSVDPNIPHRVFPNPRRTFHELNNKFSDRTMTVDAFWLRGKPSVDSSYFKEIGLKFDLIFVDGDHSYDSVKSDFFECCNILSEDGTILLHDVYTWGGVGKFAEELASDERFNAVFSDRKNSRDGFCAINMEVKI